MSAPDIGDRGFVNDVMKVYLASRLRPEVIFRSLVSAASTVAILTSNIDRAGFLEVCGEIFDHWRGVKGQLRKEN